MNELGCKAAQDWWHQSDESPFDTLERDFHTDRASLRAPRSYSKRSSRISELWSKSKWAAENVDDELIAPSKAAVSSAEALINHLPEGCLDFSLAISHSGEINFFYGDADQIFQVLVVEDGLVSYYGVVDGEEIAASDQRACDVPTLKLLRFVDRNR